MLNLKRGLPVLFAMAVLALSTASFGQPAPIVLKVADFASPVATRTQISKWWGEEVGKRSAGRVKIEYYPAEALLKAGDTFEGIRSGVADIGIWVPAYNPAVFPISALFTLPGISPKIRPALHAAHELVLTSDFKFFVDEFRRLGVEPVYLWGVADQELISTKPVRGVTDLKGLKVRVIGREWPKLIGALGGSPVALPWPEVYEALSRGTLDANVGFISANRDSKLYEVAKHHTRIYLGSPAGQFAIMNKRSWDRLPADIQDIMRQVGREYIDRLADVYEREAQEAIREMESKGVRFAEWSADDQATLKRSMESIWETWAKEMDAKGIPGREALRRYVELQKKHTR